MDISVRRTDVFNVEDRSWLGSKFGTEATRSITLATALFTKSTHFPNGVLKSGILLGRVTATGATKDMYGPYAGAPNEVQLVTVTGAPSGGTFTLTHEGGTTAAIAFNATAAVVQAALEALPSIAPRDIVVTGAAGGPYTVTFTGDLAGTNVSALTASGASLTGGSTPSVTVATSTGGGSASVNGLEVPAGFLFNTIAMETGGPNVGAPLLEFGFVIATKLPTNNGLDSAARLALASKFTFRD